MLLRGTQHLFADATPTKLRRAERVRSAAARITLQLLRLRNPAAPSAFAPRHTASLGGATPTILRRAERVRPAAPRITLRLLRLRNPAGRAERVRSAASPHHFAGATPTTLRRAEYAALRPGRIWSSHRPLRPRTSQYPHPGHAHSFLRPHP